MPAGIDFEFSMRGANSSTPRSSQVLRVLLVGHYGQANSDRLESAPVVRVDIDNLDSLFTRFEPRIIIPVDGVDMVLEPRDLDEFHPDSLLEKLPVFEALRNLRRRILDPATSEEALKNLTVATREATGAPSEPSEPAHASGESDEDALGRLLGKRPEQKVSAPAQPQTGLDSLIRSAVAPHIVEKQDPRVDDAVRSIDEGMASLLRKILASEAFREMEARWRGLYRLVQNVETGEALELRVANVSRDALMNGIPESADKLHGSGLHEFLVERFRQAADPEPPSLVVLDQEFGPDVHDLSLLGVMGTLADAGDFGVLAGANPRLLGADSVQSLGDFRRWQPPESLFPLWSTLRQASFSHRIGLVLPRVMARLPYGRDTDAVASFEFEELTAAEPREFLWSSGAVAVCEALLRRFADSGWDMDPAGPLEIEELPAFVYREAGESRMQSCTEQLMPESALEAALERGMVPLAGFRNGDRAIVPRLQSIAESRQALRVPWHQGR